MLFHDKGNGEAFILFPSTFYHYKNGKISWEAALKPGQGSEKPEGSRAMQLCRDWSRSDCSEGGESSRRGRTGPNPAPGPPALAGCWVVRKGGKMWSAPSYSPVESVPPPAEKPALTLLRQHFCSRFFFPVALWCTDHSLFVYLLILHGKEVVFTAEKKNLWAKSTILHPKVVTVVPICLIF